MQTHNRRAFRYSLRDLLAATHVTQTMTISELLVSQNPPAPLRVPTRLGCVRRISNRLFSLDFKEPISQDVRDGHQRSFSDLPRRRGAASSSSRAPSKPTTTNRLRMVRRKIQSFRLAPATSHQRAPLLRAIRRLCRSPSKPRSISGRDLQ